MEEVNELRDAIIKSLDDNKAENIVVVDLAGKSTLADYMIVASGNVSRHVVALAEHLLQDLKDQYELSIKAEGLKEGDWVLIDAGDILIHIFRPEVRDFYKIEKLWQANFFPDGH